MTRATRCGAAFLLVLCGLASAARGERRVIYIQPLGEALPDADVALARQALIAFYALPVQVLPRADLPQQAYYAPRRRYRAERLLDFLGPRLPGDGLRILGLTSTDISTTKGRFSDWGVLGLATLDGRACVISAFRCHKKASSTLHARIRLAKVAVHEVGHNFGLEHCPTRSCLMEDARGKVSTTDREHDLCARCRQELHRRGYRFPEAPAIPWPKPRAR